MVDSFVVFSSRDEIFKRSRDGSGLASFYTSSILQELELLSDSNALSQIGALIVEPGKKPVCTRIYFLDLHMLD